MKPRKSCKKAVLPMPHVLLDNSHAPNTSFRHSNGIRFVYQGGCTNFNGMFDGLSTRASHSAFLYLELVV